MLDSIKNWLTGQPAAPPASTEALIKTLGKKYKGYLADSEIPEWAENHNSYNCGWSESKQGWVVIVTSEKLSDLLN